MTGWTGIMRNKSNHHHRNLEDRLVEQHPEPREDLHLRRQTTTTQAGSRKTQPPAMQPHRQWKGQCIPMHLRTARSSSLANEHRVELCLNDVNPHELAPTVVAPHSANCGVQTLGVARESATHTMSLDSPRKRK